MQNGDLRRSTALMRQSFFDEGILDEEFTGLQRIQNKHYPNLVEEAFNVYFAISTVLLNKVEQEMNTVPIDFSKMDGTLYELSDSAASIGASKIRNEINRIRILLQDRNLESIKVAFQDLRNEHDIFKTKLEPYFQQLRLQAQLKASPSK